ncbi:hypothetical protein MiFV1_gp2 [Morchella importuna fusarivirus 1]|uniref:Uncharacterized protein n=1 Tax=Morchella importuna fusarivirus 1 TaxID=2501218 RepID=A0A3Q9NN58_9VIRU|nr:hypothetical protein MiFV1_gp2 [Morchella importuna fusarivirus 1]
MASASLMQTTTKRLESQITAIAAEAAEESKMSSGLTLFEKALLKQKHIQQKTVEYLTDLEYRDLVGLFRPTLDMLRDKYSETGKNISEVVKAIGHFGDEELHSRQDVWEADPETLKRIFLSMAGAEEALVWLEQPGFIDQLSLCYHDYFQSRACEIPKFAYLIYLEAIWQAAKDEWIIQLNLDNPPYTALNDEEILVLETHMGHYRTLVSITTSYTRTSSPAIRDCVELYGVHSDRFIRAVNREVLKNWFSTPIFLLRGKSNLDILDDWSRVFYNSHPDLLEHKMVSLRRDLAWRKGQKGPFQLSEYHNKVNKIASIPVNFFSDNLFRLLEFFPLLYIPLNLLVWMTFGPWLAWIVSLFILIWRVQHRLNPENIGKRKKKK